MSDSRDLTFQDLVDSGLHGGYGCPMMCVMTMDLVDTSMGYEQRKRECPEICPWYSKLKPDFA
jgi:hypothetical protein